jgi:hypothetical protein
VKKGGKDDEKHEEARQNNHRHPRDGTYLRRHSDGGCGKSPDATRFPLSIADEGAKVTLPPNLAPKFSASATNATAGAGEENEAKPPKGKGI